MKKVLLVLSLVLAMAFAAVPGHAAIDPDFNLTGRIDAQLMYAQNPDDPNAGYRLIGNVSRLQIQLAASGHTAGDNPKVAFSFGFGSNNNEQNNQNTATWNFGNNAFNNPGSNTSAFRITNAVATFNGAYWKNGPEVKTEIGSRTAYWDDYVAGDKDGGPASTSRPNGDGIVISGLPLGPFDSRLAHIYLDATSDRVTVSNLQGELGGFDTSLTVTSHYNIVGATGNTLVNDIHVGVGGEVASGVNFDANYATDGLNNGFVYDVEASLSTLPGIELTAGMRGVDANRAWNPRFAKRDDDACDDDADNVFFLCAHDTKNGMNLGISTTQAGVDLGLTYTTGEDPTDPDDGDTVTKFTAATKVSDIDLSGAVTLSSYADDSPVDATKYELTAKKSFGSINGSYSFSTESKTTNTPNPRNIHTFAADTTIDTPIADDVKIAGQVKLDTNFANAGVPKPQIHVSATWKAPMGLNLGAHYANYNRNNHGPIPNAGNPDTAKPLKAEGFYLTADYSVSF